MKKNSLGQKTRCDDFFRCTLLLQINGMVPAVSAGKAVLKLTSPVTHDTF